MAGEPALLLVVDQLVPALAGHQLDRQPVEEPRAREDAEDRLRVGTREPHRRPEQLALDRLAREQALVDGPQAALDLGQGGVNVSGGQKQRLCIARALISKPKIIILDDSTSAVDTATDAAIRKALNEELSSTTTIIIAQRIASVMDADRIVIMNEGKIDDVGTHAELMQRSEIYREVYYSQQKGVEE